jgi:C4-dicarboxylate transporter DctQ subunit
MWSRLDRWLSAFENASLAIGTGIAVTVATIQVLLRYTLGVGIFWAEELVVYAIIWTAFIAAGAAVRTGDHLSAELLIALVSERYVAILHRLVCVLGIAGGVALAVLGTELVRSAQDYGQTSPALELPMWVVYLVIPLSGILLAVRFAQKLLSRDGAHGSQASAEESACR